MPRSASSGRITAEGRVVAYPGAEVTVGTEVLGTIINMPVREKAAVRKGDLLVELRADDVKASLREAHHRLTEAEVGLRLERAPRRSWTEFFPSSRGKEPQPAGLADEMSSRRPLPVATPPRRRSTGSRPSRPSTESSRRSTAWSSRATSTPARRSPPALRS